MMSEEQTPKKSEDDLVKEGYKKILSRYKGVCDVCGQRFPPNTAVYWKRERGITRMVCPNCFQ